MKRQQGDVIIRKVSQVPKGAVRKEGRIFAFGEVTGHKHQVTDNTGVLYEKDGVLYFRADKPSILKHEEHADISLEEGIYEIGIVKEYDPEADEIRNVKD